jgi:hypothetical protein
LDEAFFCGEPPLNGISLFESSFFAGHFPGCFAMARADIELFKQDDGEGYKKLGNISCVSICALCFSAWLVVIQNLVQFFFGASTGIGPLESRQKVSAELTAGPHFLSSTIIARSFLFKFGNTFFIPL